MLHLNQGAYYDHQRYGRVQLVAIAGDTVSIQSTTETIRVAGATIPRAWTEPRERFIEAAEPADIEVGVSAASLGTTEPQL